MTDETIDMTPEEIKATAEAVANALASQNTNIVYEAHVVYEADMVAEIDLSTVASSAMGITDIWGQIASAITSLFNSIASWIVSSVGGFVSTAVSGLRDYIYTTIRPMIVNAIVGFVNDWVMPVIEGITPRITDYISTYIIPFLQNIAPALSNIITVLSNAIAGAITAISNAISSGITSIGNAIALTTSTITSAISSGISSIANALASSVQTLASAIASSVQIIGSSIKSLTDIVVSGIKSIGSAIASSIQTVSNALASGIQTIGSAIASLAQTILSALASGLKGLGDAIASSIQTVVTTISSGIRTLGDALSYAINQLASSVTALASSIATALSSLSRWFSDTIEKMAQMVSAGFYSIGTSLQNVYNAILPVANIFAGLPEKVIENIRNFITLFFSIPIQLIEYQVPSQEYISKISPTPPPTGEFLSVSVPKIPTIPPITKAPFTISIIPWINILENPLGWFAEKIYDVLQKIGETIWNTITYITNVFYTRVNETFKVIADAIKGGLETLFRIGYNIIVSAVNSVISVLTTISGELSKALSAIGATVAGIIPTFSNIINTLGQAFKPIIDLIYTPFSIAMQTYLANTVVLPIVQNARATFGIHSPEELSDKYVEQQITNMGASALLIMFSPIMASVGIRALIWNAKSIGAFLENMVFELLIKVAPVGIGGEGRFDLAKAIGASVKQFIWELPKLLEHYEIGLAYGVSIWVTQPITKLFNLYLRNVITVRLPQEQDLVEMVRRYLPRPDAKDMVKVAKYYMAVDGFSDYMIDKYMEIENPKTITVTDRFNYTREVPLSLVYELPSASDVATMMVRDIFPTFDEFQKLYLARGMHPDVGALYYFLRFRYPPPERLWNFTMRGISGLLWATLPDVERQQIAVDADPIHAFYKSGDLRAPAELNFDTTTLLNSFKTYMKWHDYARFAWVKGFTSDNLIMVDTLADIPTKIDQRWMVKWGIYETLSEKGVTYQSLIQEFVTKYITTAPSSGIQMDITNFCRTLQATGLHPYWVPTTAVAETMNALTEERTLLRTGFMGLFKEGFYDINALETMLSGFIITSFKVAYFDIQTSQWRTAYVDQPVMFLPPERRLLELRALMDRSLDILRDIQKDVSVAYQEFIVWDYNEYKSKLSQVIESINTFYATDYEAITGTKLPEELKLKFVEDYYKPYVEALRIWRDVFTIRRVRMWTQRWIGWVIYRVAYGGVKKEDVEKLVTYVSSKAKLTDYETGFIKDVMELMYGIAKQSTVAEYLPTPSTMATLSEYMTLPEDLVKNVLIERGLPEQWMNIWLTYVKVKPIKADAKALLSTYVRAFRAGVVGKDVVDTYIKQLPQYGFTPKEIEFITTSVQLEEQIADAKEYIPTPTTLATLCEYLPEAREFFPDIVKAKRIPERWQNLWAKYIDIKPLINDMKTYLSRAESLYTNFMIKKDTFMQVLNDVGDKLGYTPKEVEFLMKTTEFERYRRAWTELIGTVKRLVDLSEYSPKASKYALGKLYEMIDALPLSATEKADLKAMWEEYIRNRPVKAEAKTYITQLINMFVEGLISSDAFNKEMDAMKEWGFSDAEIMFYKAQASLRKARKLKIPLPGE
jgi:phage-related protein